MAEQADRPKILIVDDDSLVLRALAATLKRDFDVRSADGGAAALSVLAAEPDVAVAVIDQRMPTMSGPELIRAMVDPHPDVVRIILTGYQDIDSLKEAINNGGAYRYLEKPCANDELLAAVRAGAALHARIVAGREAPELLEAANDELRRANADLQRENLELRQAADHAFLVGERRLVGGSAALRAVVAAADQMATTDTSVLIEGETGTGKDLIARRIHEQSARRDATFRAQNCGAVAESFIEDTLFGHVAGAFTGARTDKRGLFEIADGGTLFLDEIGECSPALQARLLRVVEEKVVYRLGDDERPWPVDVRLVAATNRDLEAEVSSGSFRQDLYYRLSVFSLRVPPLRERREDIPELVRHFLDVINQRATQLSGKVVGDVDPGALDLLVGFEFPGNIRELSSVIERAWLFADDGGTIASEHVQLACPQADGEASGSLGAGDEQTLRGGVAAFKAKFIEAALIANDWNVATTAKLLEISRGRLYEEMRTFGLVRPSK